MLERGAIGGFRDTSGGLLVPSHLLGHKYQEFTSPSVLNPSEKRGLSTAINYLLDY